VLMWFLFTKRRFWNNTIAVCYFHLSISHLFSGTNEFLAERPKFKNYQLRISVLFGDETSFVRCSPLFIVNSPIIWRTNGYLHILWKPCNLLMVYLTTPLVAETL
jgi:hypothetical protein